MGPMKPQQAGYIGPQCLGIPPHKECKRNSVGTHMQNHTGITTANLKIIQCKNKNKLPFN